MDTTESARATQVLLQESEQRYRALFVDHIDAVITTDREGCFLFVNPAFEKMIGIPADRLQGTHFLPLVLPKLHEKTMREFGVAMDGHTVEYETTLIDDTKHEIDIHVMLIPVIAEGEVREIHCIAKDITSIRRAHRDLERMAFTHQLTGLPNRNALDEHLAGLVQLGGMFSVMNLDLNRLKAVNDRYGRRIGDSLLKAVAGRLDGHIAAPTRLFQNNGDSFVIVHPHQRDEEALEYASVVEKLLRAPFDLDGQHVATSVSIGVCVFPQYGDDPESLLRRSEDAMLEAKKRGRRQIAFYRELAPDDDSRALKLEFALRQALEQENLALVYQPQVDVRSGEIHGAEALLRWTDPDFGSISPAEFIPIAERTGLIHEIGMWVLEQACQQLCEWERRGHTNLRVAVNVSIDQFYDAEFLGRMEHVIRSSGIEPQALVLEVTESIAANADTVVNQLHRLKQLGVGIAIDDFGTGYSSLRYLRDFPVDHLKIDRSFIGKLEEHESDRNLVATIIELARNFGLFTIAEGVETAKQLQILKELGGGFAQGYHISRPISPDQFEKLLDETCSGV